MRCLNQKTLHLSIKPFSQEVPSVSSITIEVAESVLLATGQSREEFARDARFLLAAKLFELGRLSSGKAAQLCDMAHPDFLFAAGRLGVPVVQLTGEELDREFQND